MDHRCNYKLKLETLEHAPDGFKRYIFKDDNTVYVYSYKRILDKLQVVIKNIHGVTGEEFSEVFEIPYNDVTSINTINYKTIYANDKKNIS